MKTALGIRPQTILAPQRQTSLADQFLAQLDDALVQVDPIIQGEVKWLANVGLVVEAERLLIDYLLTDHPRYEIVAEERFTSVRHKLDSFAMALWMCRVTDWNVFGAFAGCMTWVFMGS